MDTVHASTRLLCGPSQSMLVEVLSGLSSADPEQVVNKWPVPSFALQCLDLSKEGHKVLGCLTPLVVPVSSKVHTS